MIHQEINKKVEWKDLRTLNIWEVFVENNITLPWLVVSLVLAYFEYYLLAMPFSAVFFLTGLRQVHNGFHNALGTNKFFTRMCLYVNSTLMMASMHAVKFNHLRHHKYCLEEEDYEGRSAKMKWYVAVLYGPLHIYHIHRITLEKGNWIYKRNMFFEVLLFIGLAVVAFGLDLNWLKYHVMVMIAGEFLSAFFAVWTVHHDAEEQPMQSRTQRTKWKNVITFNMFYHLEHHLFPAVPTIKLPELAERIDKAKLDLNIKATF